MGTAVSDGRVGRGVPLQGLAAQDHLHNHHRALRRRRILLFTSLSATGVFPTAVLRAAQNSTTSVALSVSIIARGVAAAVMVAHGSEGEAEGVLFARENDGAPRARRR